MLELWEDDDDASVTLFCDVVSRESLSFPLCLEFLLKEGADSVAAQLVLRLGSTCFLGPLPQSKSKLFHFAIQNGCVATVEKLLLSFDREKLDDGQPVLICVVYCQTGLLERLLSLGFRSKNDKGLLATNWAVYNKRWGSFSILLKYGIPIVGVDLNWVRNKDAIKIVEVSDPHHLQNPADLASLKEICRLSIRRQLPLTETNAFVAVEKLPLPTSLKKYLVFDVNPDLGLEDY